MSLEKSFKDFFSNFLSNESEIRNKGYVCRGTNKLPNAKTAMFYFQNSVRPVKIFQKFIKPMHPYRNKTHE